MNSDLDDLGDALKFASDSIKIRDALKGITTEIIDHKTIARSKNREGAKTYCSKVHLFTLNSFLIKTKTQAVSGQVRFD